MATSSSSTQIVFPELTALSDVLPLLRRIWKILQQYDPTDDLVLFQQDIAGFFNAYTPLSKAWTYKMILFSA